MPLHVSALVLAALLQAAPSQPDWQTQAAAVSHVELNKDLEERMTAAQKQQFEAAYSLGAAQKYAEALPRFKAMLQDFPGDTLLLKYVANAALQMGDSAYALNVLKPIALANPEDWQAVSMLVQAASEAGDKQTRNAAMLNMGMLKQHGLTPPSLVQYVVERVKVGENILTISHSLVAYGGYKVYDSGELDDAKGVRIMRVEIESPDYDQKMFARVHPMEAASGVRQFSLDGYLEPVMTPDGQQTQTHITYKLFMGQLSVDHVREEFLNVVTGKTPYSLSSTKPVVQR
jgi:tetratricopeptide (TPR) repeat protein